MDDFIDGVAICIYCGFFLDTYPNEKQMKIFGKPRCCDYDMLKIERNKLHTIVRAIDKLKGNLESELLKGTI